MRKRLKIISLLLCSGICLAGGISGAIAWFDQTARIQPQSGLVGESQGAYFARGEGTSSSPFIINKPIHLYNLAWLQYIGYFNDANAPYYFALDPIDSETVLDMSGWVLPPIGTSLYPFIGNFEGHGETIENLTIDNVVSTGHIEKTPTLINANSVDANHVLKIYQKGETVGTGSYLNSTVDVVGFFGFIGDNPNMEAVSASYSAANSINSVALDGLEVRSSSSSTLVGFVCGYDNAVLNGVAVNNSNLYAKPNATAITSVTNNLSDYSLVGYATSSALSKCFIREDTASLPKLNNPNTQNGGQNWGGSIDMLQLYTQLAEIRDAHSGTSYIPATSAFTYNTAETYLDGVIQPAETTTSVNNRSVTNGNYWNATTYYYRYEGNKLTYNDPTHNNPDYASFSFARELDSSFSTYGDGEDQSYKYNCLYGAKEFTGFTKTVKNKKTGTGFQIKSGSHYIRNNNGTLEDGNSGNAAVFFWDGSKLYCYYGDNSTQKYYLRLNGTTLSLDTDSNNGASWTYNNANQSFVSSSNYAITYTNTWTVTATPRTVYTISYTSGNVTHYLCASSTGSTPTLYDSTSLIEDAYWNYSTYYTVTRNNTTYYLKYNSGIALATGNSGNRFTNNNNYVRYKSGNTNYYVRYNNGWTATTQTTNRAVAASRSITPVCNIETPEADYVYLASSGNQSSSYTTYDTYFPLLMEPNTYKPMNEYIDPNDETGQKKFNTGYIVSGCNDTVSSAYQQVWGDIRISAYPYSALTDTTTVTTRTRYLSGANSVDSNWQELTTVNDAAALKFQKYTSSHAKLETLLSESAQSSYIHGLHFMSATISKSNLATIGRAVVLDGKTPQVQNENGTWEDRASVYDGYQVPEDSIDFNLKSHGYINFYAGTYFSGNNCFFSLHQITRDANNDIDEIRHISKVYCPDYTDASGNYRLGDADHPYIYQFADNKWSAYSKVDDEWVSTAVTQAPAHGPLLFDCTWIENPGTLTNNGLYYFEIPVNAGEYALGSVQNGTGAYLLYLDIGSGAANYKDVTLDENLVISITELIFPTGVDFVDLNVHANDFATVATGGRSGVVEVSPANTGIAINYAFTTNQVTGKSALALTKAGNDPPNMPSSIFDLISKDEGVSATYLGAAISSSTSTTYTITMEKEIIESYNPNVGSEYANETVPEPTLGL